MTFGNGHLLSIHDLSARDVADVIELGRAMKLNPGAYRKVLDGQTLAMIFMKSSTRTRVSFEVGMYQLGGSALFLRVLSRYVDGIMARTFDHADVTGLAEHGSVPVINGLTDLLHPCQALADLMTMTEVLGGLAGKTLAYIGDGNNMAHSLMFAASKAGMHFVCVSPQGYAMEPAMVELGIEDAQAAGTDLIQSEDMADAAGAHVIYTDVWASMGQEEEQSIRLQDFSGYTVDRRVMEQAAPGAIFMHCLPAHRGEEVSAEVCDGPSSVIFDQAENRLHAQKAIMAKLMGDL
jgi:ornithine carbamoyltransferase